ncbi:MAG: hypothetical protein FJ137_11435 [Deltaproteobacteria bacterium]|nr:hypothetical protein [Deltaproteobacteria bacterium]
MMSETGGDDDNEGKLGKDADGNVVRIDFAARRQRLDQQRQKQQRVADAARLRPAPTELGPERPEKLRMFARLIEQGMTMVTLDARRDGVSVPAHLSAELMLNLNFCLRFGINDFAYDDDGVRATLTFHKVPFFCEVPWSAVYQLTSTVNADRLVWPDSLPAELADRVPPQVRPAARPQPRPAPPIPVPALPPPPADSTSTTTPAQSASPPPVDDPPATAPGVTDDSGPGDEGPRPPSPPRPTLRRVK